MTKMEKRLTDEERKWIALFAQARYDPTRDRHAEALKALVSSSPHPSYQQWKEFLKESIQHRTKIIEHEIEKLKTREGKTLYAHRLHCDKCRKTFNTLLQEFHRKNVPYTQAFELARGFLEKNNPSELKNLRAVWKRMRGTLESWSPDDPHYSLMTRSPSGRLNGYSQTLLATIYSSLMKIQTPQLRATKRGVRKIVMSFGMEFGLPDNIIRPLSDYLVMKFFQPV
jgi:hypothetical protein